MDKITLAAACMLAEHDTPGNLKKIQQFIIEAAEADAQLLVFPEGALQGYLWTWNWEKHIYQEDVEQAKYFHQVAETIPGPSTNLIAEYAKRYNMIIQVGMVEKVAKDPPVLFNSVAIIGPTGLIGKFRKIHSTTERIIFQGGKELPIFNTMVGKIGPLICYDLAFPESVRVLALKGAKLITFSTAWGMDPRNDSSGYRYDLLTRTNAMMSGVWMVCSNQVSVAKRSDEACFGHSRIIDPQGNIVAGIGYEEGLVMAKVDVKALDPTRFNDRCPSAYGILTVPKPL